MRIGIQSIGGELEEEDDVMRSLSVCYLILFLS